MSRHISKDTFGYSVEYPQHLISLKLCCLLPCLGFPAGSEVKASACNAGDLGSIPGLGRSPGEGNSNLLHYSVLENPMRRGARWTTVHGVAKSQTRLSNFTLQGNQNILIYILIYILYPSPSKMFFRTPFLLNAGANQSLHFAFGYCHCLKET